MEVEAPYGFAATPHVVGSKPKYKDPYGRQDLEGPPANLMFDKRVHRGNTFAQIVMQGQGGMGGGDRLPAPMPRRVPNSVKARQMAEDQARAEMSTPKTPEGRQHMDVQTDPRVEELTDKAPSYELAIQTDFVIDRPPTPLQIPIKTGSDMGTEIEDNELFEFDKEVRPLLSVVTSKCLEHARMEVLEEEELREIRDKQSYYEELKAKEIAEAGDLEAAELRRMKDSEKRKIEGRARKDLQIKAHRKLMARMISKDYIQGVLPLSMRRLTDQGLFKADKEHDIYTEFVPWMTSELQQLVTSQNKYLPFYASCLEDYIEKTENEHKRAVEKCHKVIEKKKMTEIKRKEKVHKDKLERKAIREEKRRVAAKDRLMKEIEQTFLSGEDTDKMLLQEISNVNGQYLKKPIIGLVGGLFTEIVNIMTVASDMVKNPDLFTDKMTMQFFGSYLSNCLRSEAFYWLISPQLVSYLTEKEVTLEEINSPNLTKEHIEQIGEMMKSNIGGDPIIELIKNNLDKFGLNVNCWERLTHALFRLVVKKEREPEMHGRTNLARQKIFLVPSPDILTLETPNERAIVRVRVPLPKVEEDEEEAESAPPTKGKDKNKEGKGSQNATMLKDTDTAELEYEDRVRLVIPQTEQMSIFVIHQAAGIEVRREIGAYIRKVCKELDNVDPEEFDANVSERALEVEEAFMNEFSNLVVFNYEIN